MFCLKLSSWPFLAPWTPLHRWNESNTLHNPEMWFFIFYCVNIFAPKKKNCANISWSCKQFCLHICWHSYIVQQINNNNVPCVHKKFNLVLPALWICTFFAVGTYGLNTRLHASPIFNSSHDFFFTQSWIVWIVPYSHSEPFP